MDGVSLAACIEATHVTFFKHCEKKEENFIAT